MRIMKWEILNAKSLPEGTCGSDVMINNIIYKICGYTDSGQTPLVKKHNNTQIFEVHKL